MAKRKEHWIGEKSRITEMRIVCPVGHVEIRKGIDGAWTLGFITDELQAITGNRIDISAAYLEPHYGGEGPRDRQVKRLLKTVGKRGVSVVARARKSK